MRREIEDKQQQHMTGERSNKKQIYDGLRIDLSDKGIGVASVFGARGQESYFAPPPLWKIKSHPM